MNMKLAQRIAQWIYWEATTNTESGSWITYKNEIENEFDTQVTEDNLELIAILLSFHPGVAESVHGYECVDIMLYGNYCDLDFDEED